MSQPTTTAPAPAPATTAAPTTSPYAAPAPAPAAGVKDDDGEARASDLRAAGLPSRADIEARVFGSAHPAPIAPAPAPTAPAAISPAPTASAVETAPSSPPPADLARAIAERDAAIAELARLRAAAAKPAPQAAPVAPVPQPAPQPAQVGDAPPPDDAAFRKRLLDEPHYAQAVQLFTSQAPAYLLDEASQALKVRSSWQVHLDSPEHGAKARHVVAQADRQIARLQYEAERAKLDAARIAPAQPEAQAAAPAWGDAASRLQLAGDMLAVLADPSSQYHQACKDAIGHLSEQEILTLALRIEGSTPEEFAEKLEAEAATRRPAAGAAPTTAAPAPGAQPAPRNPAPTAPTDKPLGESSAPWHPPDRLLTFREQQDRVLGRN